METKRRQVVTILSTGYAGSHFVSLLLGSNSRTLHVGELLMTKREQPDQGRECTFERGNVLAGIGPDNYLQAYDIIFSRLPPGKNALIDASKKVRGWADFFLNRSDFDRKYLHLIRDPRALVRRWKPRLVKNKKSRLRTRVIFHNPRWIFQAWAGGDNRLLTLRWLMENQKITQFIRRNKLDFERVTYRDLALDPGREIHRLMDWIGLPYEPSQLEFWKFDHVGTQKNVYKTKEGITIDLRWQQELSAEEQREIIEHPDVVRYLREIELRALPDGLTRYR